MELRQYRRILTARKKFLTGILIIDTLSIIICAWICERVLNKNISLFTVLIFGISIISISIVYDMYRNACYRLFISGDDVIIYYPTPSQRAGDEFIFYKIQDLSLLKLTGSSIRFQGHMLVKTEGIKRPDINTFTDDKSFFADVFSTGNTYVIEKRFRVTRIYENEEKLLDLLKVKLK